jgi:hypothetical protein
MLLIGGIEMKLFDLVVCIIALYLLFGCTSGRTGDALQALGTWDVANYGGQVNLHLQVEKADFTLPQMPMSPIHVEGLVLMLHLKLGKYGGDELLLSKMDTSGNLRGGDE